MGRKIDLKKIEDVTKCQVTFSKRRSSLIKKANEIAVCCDVDVAFVAFSPSGRVSKYCNKKRIEEVLQRYVDLPPESRLTHIENVQGKMEKLNKISYIKSDSSKLQFLDKRIENLELQIKKCGLELQILEADLRDYEVAPEQEPPSLHQLSWCERNLKHSLEKVMARKMEMEKQTGLQQSSNFNDNELASIIQNDEAGEIMANLDPWISPYSATVRESLFQDLVNQTNIATPNMNHAGPSNVYNFPLPHFSNIFESGFTNMTCDAQIPLEQSSMVGPLPKLPDQINADTWNNFSSVNFPDAAHMTTQTLRGFQAPRFTSTTTVTPNACSGKMPQPLYNEVIGTSSQFASSNFNQFNNMEGGETIGQPYMNFGNNLSNTNAINGSIAVGGSGGRNSSQMQQIQTPSGNMEGGETIGQQYMSFGNNLSNINAINGSIAVGGSGGLNSSQMQQIQNPSDNMEGGETIGQQYMNFGNNLSNINAINGSIAVGGSGGLNSSQMQQIQNPSDNMEGGETIGQQYMNFGNNLSNTNAIYGSINVGGSGGLNSSQMQQKQAPSDNMVGGETIGQQYMNFGNILSNTNAINGSIAVGGSGGLNSSQMQQIQAPSDNMEGGETIGQQYMNFGNNFSNTNAINGSIDVGGSGGLNSSRMQQIQTPSEYLQPEKDFGEDKMFDNLNQEPLGQNMLWPSNTQESGSWEWEDLLLSDNFQLGDSFKNLF